MKTEKKLINLQPSWQPTKSEIAKVTEQLTKSVIDGSMEPLKAMATIKALEAAIEKAIEIMKPYILDELSKYKTGEVVTALGVEFKHMEARPVYDYLLCGDGELNRLMVLKNDIDSKVKARQEFLRKLTRPEFITDQETGEICEVHPPQKKTTPTFTTKFSD